MGWPFRLRREGVERYLLLQDGCRRLQRHQEGCPPEVTAKNTEAHSRKRSASEQPLGLVARRAPVSFGEWSSGRSLCSRCVPQRTGGSAQANRPVRLLG